MRVSETSGATGDGASTNCASGDVAAGGCVCDPMASRTARRRCKGVVVDARVPGVHAEGHVKALQPARAAVAKGATNADRRPGALGMICAAGGGALRGHCLGREARVARVSAYLEDILRFGWSRQRPTPLAIPPPTMAVYNVYPANTTMEMCLEPEWIRTSLSNSTSLASVAQSLLCGVIRTIHIPSFATWGLPPKPNHNKKQTRSALRQRRRHAVDALETEKDDNQQQRARARAPPRAAVCPRAQLKGSWRKRSCCACGARAHNPRYRRPNVYEWPHMTEAPFVGRCPLCAALRPSAMANARPPTS